MDGSESIFADEFVQLRDFVSLLGATLLGDTSSDTAISLAEYSTGYQQLLTEFVNDESIFATAAGSLTQSLGITNTGSAMLNAIDFIVANRRTKVLPRRGTFDATPVLVVLTDGVTSDNDVNNLNLALDRMTSLGIVSVAVGVGGRLSFADVVPLSQFEANLTFVDLPFSNLTSALNPLVAAIHSRCPAPVVPQFLCSTTPVSTVSTTATTTLTTSASTSPSSTPTTTKETTHSTSLSTSATTSVSTTPTTLPTTPCFPGTTPTPGKLLLIVKKI